MAEKETRASSAPPPRPQGQRLRQFRAPEELPGAFGVQVQDDGHIQGVVATENVRALLDGFGLDDRKQIVFPFSHMKKQHGEVWSMRIEPQAVHHVEGQAVVGHTWLFRQEQPERVGSVQ